MNNISEAMARIVTLEASLSITDPVTQSIKRAYKYFPSRGSAAPDRPFWMNTWTLIDQNRQPNGWDWPLYKVNAQLVVEDADLDRAAEIATAFHEKFLVAFDADLTLNDGTGIQAIRGEEPTLTLLEWAGASYVGLDMVIDVRLARIRTFSP